MSYARVRLALFGIIAACALSSAPAFAQDEGVVFVPTFLSSTTSYGGVTTSGIGTTVAVVWIMTPSRASAHLELYLRHNHAQVEQALSLGGDQASQDLAHFFGVSPQHYPAFAKTLRQERQALLALAAPEAPRAAQFIAHVTKTMLAHHALRHDVPTSAR